MKLHVSMKVRDFPAAKRFYTQLFGQAPVIEKAAYAKWDVTEPAVNFVIEAGKGKAGLDHLGIQAETGDELGALAGRMRESGHAFVDVEKASCCYAKMDKAWVKGAAGEKWEAFLTHSHDEPEYGGDREHLLDSM